MGFDVLEWDRELAQQFQSLPEGVPWSEDADVPDEQGPDFEWGEVLGALVGDTDIAMLWTLSLDGIDDPDEAINQDMGIGDYRPQSWHRMFDRYVKEPEMESSLF